MIEFKKYNSIENTYRTKFINKIEQNGLGGVRYAVKEKIHGSNISMTITENSIKVASRSGYLEDDDSFHNYKAPLLEIREALFALHKHFISEEVPTPFIRLYGELFGGSYPHKDVPKVQNSNKIQKGVFYHPDNKILFFDMMVNGRYVDNDTFDSLCKEYSVPFIPTMFEGNLQECLEFNNVFNSTIPALYGLPPFDENICEGVVIKPVVPVFLGDSRVILKNKTQKFLEVKDKKEVKVQEDLPVEAANVLSILETHITENRLRNVLSKVGEVTDRDFGKILGMFNKDVWDEFKADELNTILLQSLEKDLQKRVSKMMNNETAKMIRTNFLNIIDNVF